MCSLPREETEIIEGEVVEIQIDRPATGTVSCGTDRVWGGPLPAWQGTEEAAVIQLRPGVSPLKPSMEQRKLLGGC